jgi:hypothetical protein
LPLLALDEREDAVVVLNTLGPSRRRAKGA